MAASSPSPGGTLQSTLSDARDGITLILSEAWIIVGVRVTPSIGSTKMRSAGAVSAIARSAAAGSSES